MHDILANPAAQFVIAGLIGLAVTAAMYGCASLLIRLGVCRDS